MFAKTGDEVILAALQRYRVEGGSPVSLRGPSLVSANCVRVCENGRRNHVGSVAAITRCSGKSCIPKRAFLYIVIASVSATTRGEAAGREAEKRRGRDAERQTRRKAEM